MVPLGPAMPAPDSLVGSGTERDQAGRACNLVQPTGVSGLWASGTEDAGEKISSPTSGAKTPGQCLEDLSLRFAGRADHHAALGRYCELADEYYQQHGLSFSDAASHAHTGVLFEFGDGGAAAMLRPEILDKLPKPSAPLEQMLFVYQSPPQKRSRKRRQQQEAGCDG